MRRAQVMTSVWIAAALLCAPGCRREQRSEAPPRVTLTAPEETSSTRPPQPEGPRVSVAISEGLMGPEAAIHDPVADVYLVSNINGNPAEKDDNGFISRVLPSGKIDQLKWIDGSKPEVTLHGPKGMVLGADTLYVADVDGVRLFDRRSGAPRGFWPVPDATFLNDVAMDDQGRVLLTETAVKLTPQGPEHVGTDAIYQFDKDGKRTTLASGDALRGPNGIEWTPQGPLFVAFRGREVYRLEGKEPKLVATLPFNQLDGLVILPDGSLLVSSWGAQGVYHVDPHGKATLIVQGVLTPASIGFDQKRSLILIPATNLNQVRLEHWP